MPEARALVLALLLAAAGCGEAAPRHDVFLISVDTLRADRLGAYGSDAGLTPRLDALAAESIVFERAWAPAPFTLPSVSGLLTGRHPAATGIRSNLGVLPEGVPTLASLLRAEGFRTGAVVSNFALRDVTGLDRDFEIYDDQFTQVEANRRQPERGAGDTRAAALAALDQLSEGDAPIFLWVHFQDPHGPYTPPDGYREQRLAAAPAGADDRELATAPRGLGGIPPYQLLGDERRAGFYRAGYDAEVRYADEEIGALLDGIAARGRLADAMLIFAADHGEALGEGDYWFAHGEFLSEPLVRVPLLVRAPGRPPDRRRDAASLLDVPATVLGRLGLTGGLSDGRDLLAPGAHARPKSLLLSTFAESRVPRVALVHQGYKLVVSRGPEGRREQLFRVGDDAHDLSREAPEHTASLRSRLARRHAAFPPPSEELRQDLSDVERARLEALGYIERR